MSENRMTRRPANRTRVTDRCSSRMSAMSPIRGNRHGICIAFDAQHRRAAHPTLLLLRPAPRPIDCFLGAPRQIPFPDDAAPRIDAGRERHADREAAATIWVRGPPVAAVAASLADKVHPAEISDAAHGPDVAATSSSVGCGSGGRGIVGRQGPRRQDLGRSTWPGVATASSSVGCAAGGRRIVGRQGPRYRDLGRSAWPGVAATSSSVGCAAGGPRHRWPTRSTPPGSRTQHSPGVAATSSSVECAAGGPRHRWPTRSPPPESRTQHMARSSPPPPRVLGARPTRSPPPGSRTQHMAGRRHRQLERWVRGRRSRHRWPTRCTPPGSQTQHMAGRHRRQLERWVRGRRSRHRRPTRFTPPRSRTQHMARASPRPARALGARPAVAASLVDKIYAAEISDAAQGQDVWTGPRIGIPEGRGRGLAHVPPSAMYPVDLSAMYPVCALS
jgi:hypothetical protein